MSTNERSPSIDVDTYIKEILSTLLQEGSVYICGYKISLKRLQSTEIQDSRSILEKLEEFIKIDILKKQEGENNKIFALLSLKGYPFVEESNHKIFRTYDSRLYQSFNVFLESMLHIHFTNLQYLNLWACKLHNIEAITFLNAPTITRIDLRSNQLANVNALIKCNFPNLQYLSIGDNPLQETEKLGRYNSEKLKELLIQHFDNEHILIEDVRFLLKLNYENQPKEIHLYHSENKLENKGSIRKILTRLNRKENYFLYNIEEIYFKDNYEMGLF